MNEARTFTKSALILGDNSGTVYKLAEPITVRPDQLLRVFYNHAGEPVEAVATPLDKTTRASKAGFARAAALTPEQRKAAAVHAATTRWNKTRKQVARLDLVSMFKAITMTTKNTPSLLPLDEHELAEIVEILLNTKDFGGSMWEALQDWMAENRKVTASEQSRAMVAAASAWDRIRREAREAAIQGERR